MAVVRLSFFAEDFLWWFIICVPQQHIRFTCITNLWLSSHFLYPSPFLVNATPSKGPLGGYRSNLGHLLPGNDPWRTEECQAPRAVICAGTGAQGDLGCRWTARLSEAAIHLLPWLVSAEGVLNPHSSLQTHPSMPSGHKGGSGHGIGATPRWSSSEIDAMPRHSSNEHWNMGASRIVINIQMLLP